ncbi:hypothetical protein D046_4263B, partial [Vibrio parahaemolyticus V-223/04]
FQWISSLRGRLNF